MTLRLQDVVHMNVNTADTITLEEWVDMLNSQNLLQSAVVCSAVVVGG